MYSIDAAPQQHGRFLKINILTYINLEIHAVIYKLFIEFSMKKIRYAVQRDMTRARMTPTVVSKKAF